VGEYPVPEHRHDDDRDLGGWRLRTIIVGAIGILMILEGGHAIISAA